MNKSDIQKLIILGLEFKNATVKKLEKANCFHFFLEGEAYTVFHKHKNEKGSLLGHCTKEELQRMEEEKVENSKACIAFSFLYENKYLEKKELLLFISTIDNIKKESLNEFNQAIKIGDKTGNYIFKYNSEIEKLFLAKSIDILYSNIVV